MLDLIFFIVLVGIPCLIFYFGKNKTLVILNILIVFVFFSFIFLHDGILYFEGERGQFYDYEDEIDDKGINESILYVGSFSIIFLVIVTYIYINKMFINKTNEINIDEDGSICIGIQVTETILFSLLIIIYSIVWL